MRRLIECALAKPSDAKQATASPDFRDLWSIPRMARSAVGFRVASVALLACGCGNDAMDANGGPSGGAGPGIGGSASGGSEQGSGGDGGEAASGGSEQGSGGDGGAAPKECERVDGKLAYGPIGEPWPWPLDTVSTSSGDCSACSVIVDYAAFRTATGYGFVWSTGFDENTPSPNLFAMTVDQNFEGGEPRVLLTENRARSLAVAPAANGFVVSTCSHDSKPEWIWLDANLQLEETRRFAPEGALCYSLRPPPPVLWTGERYLTAFTDPRGLVLASLDEQGALVREEILSPELDEPTIARFSKNGDRVLFVFNAGAEEQLRYNLLDLEGTLLGAPEPFGVEVDSFRTDFLITTSGEGWWAVNDTGGSSELPATLTAISKDGLATPGSALGELSLYAFTPSSSGGSLLLTHWYEDDLHGHAFNRMMVIDEGGEVVFSAEADHSGDGPFPGNIVVDPLRDLVIEDRRVDGYLDNMVIQEYGCLE